jgi:hypothetical protein
MQDEIRNEEAYSPCLVSASLYYSVGYYMFSELRAHS